MFEHVVNAVYIPSDDVISHRLDVFGGLLSRQFYDINSEICRQRLESCMAWHGTALDTLAHMVITWSGNNSLCASVMF